LGREKRHNETSLTDAQWAYLKAMLPKPAKRGRPPIDRRRILDAILYLVKCGCPWRYLPSDFPAWKTVYPVFRQWIRTHQWAALNDALRTLVRSTHGKRSRPTAAILDSQSVKSAGHGGSVGYDAGKRIKGRKRHLLVDTLGLVLGVAVTPASTTERDGAQMVLGRVLGWFTWLRILWVDGWLHG
jgi:transposase